MSHAKRVTVSSKDVTDVTEFIFHSYSRRDTETAGRRTPCPAENTWPNHVKTEQHIGSN